MLGKTHLAIGVATSMLILQPKSVGEVIMSIGMGGIGSLVSDIDVGTSESHHDADVVVGLTIGVLVLSIMSDYFWGTGILQHVFYTDRKRFLMGFIVFIIICGIGKETAHRSFMHSILALLLLSISIWLIYPMFVPYFVVGFLSHIFIDCFNRTKVQILFPLPIGISLKMFHSHGIANNAFFMIGIVGCVIGILKYVFKM